MLRLTLACLILTLSPWRAGAEDALVDDFEALVKPAPSRAAIPGAQLHVRPGRAALGCQAFRGAWILAAAGTDGLRWR